MKLTLSLCCAVLTATAAHAQILRPEAVNGALLGGIAGAIVGHNSGDLRHNAWKGAAIGAGAGLIAGEMVGNQRARGHNGPGPVPGHRSGGGYIYRESPAVYAGFGYGHRDFGRGPAIGHRRYGPWSHHPGGYGHSHGYYRPRATVRIGYGYHPGYDYGYYPGHRYYPDYGYGSYSGSGLFWGGLAGAIIGHNSGTFRHDAWRGAAWGAGAGWLLGTIADASRRAVAYEPAAVSAPPVATAPVAAPAQPVTIINNYYHAPATPMSAANGLFGR